MESAQFLVHNEGDHVGVAVEDVAPGRASAVCLDSRKRIDLEVLEPVPLGHKVALVDLGAGDPLIEYRLPVGVTRTTIERGRLVHVHNVRSARWSR